MAEALTLTFRKGGKLTFPPHLRRRLGIGEGTRIKIAIHRRTLVLTPINAAYISAMRGKFAALGTSTDDLEKSRRVDRTPKNPTDRGITLSGCR